MLRGRGNHQDKRHDDEVCRGEQWQSGMEMEREKSMKHPLIQIPKNSTKYFLVVI
jgi:hypothetical protein